MKLRPVPYMGLWAVLSCHASPDHADASSPSPDSATTPLSHDSSTPDSICGIACSNMADLGCTEGKRSDCQKALTSPPVNCACLAAAKDKTTVRACGIQCP
jgi:hypothetical protein